MRQLMYVAIVTSAVLWMSGCAEDEPEANNTTSMTSSSTTNSTSNNTSSNNTSSNNTSSNTSANNTNSGGASDGKPCGGIEITVGEIDMPWTFGPGRFNSGMPMVLKVVGASRGTTMQNFVLDVIGSYTGPGSYMGAMTVSRTEPDGSSVVLNAIPTESLMVEAKDIADDGVELSFTGKLNRSSTDAGGMGMMDQVDVTGKITAYPSLIPSAVSCSD